MIHVFFDCGSFGSTIEFVLHNFTNHQRKISGHILPDGSMHSFKKEYHIINTQLLNDFVGENCASDSITTPTYPFKDMKLPDMLELFSQYQTWNTDKKILIYQPTLQAAELNLLFKYHKVCYGKINAGLGIIVGDNQHNLAGWNKDYTHWSQMQIWELREWLSIFYPGWVTEFIEAPQHVDPDQWLILTNTDILYDTRKSLEKIIDFCGFTVEKDLEPFVQQWQQAQAYIVNEYDLLDNIVRCSIAGEKLQWAPINIIAESIVQQRLRSQGYEIRCQDLNTFPTNSIDLHQILDYGVNLHQ